MTRTWLIALALAATAALLWLVTSWNTQGDRPPAPSEEVTVEVPAAAEPLAEPLAEAPQAAPLDPAEPVAAPAPSAAPAPAEAPSQPQPAPQLPPPERTGPVDELKARFASEPRDSSAGALEKQIEAAFRSTDVPPALLKSVLCRRTVCRVQTRWAPDRGIGFMAAFTRLLMVPPDSPAPRLFDPNLAVSPEGAADANGEQAVDVYIARLPPAEAEPAR